MLQACFSMKRGSDRRSWPSRQARALALLRKGTPIEMECGTQGEKVKGGDGERERKLGLAKVRWNWSSGGPPQGRKDCGDGSGKRTLGMAREGGS